MLFFNLLVAFGTLSLVTARCGVNFGGTSCPAGYCCSESGWCGTTSDYCKSPACQLDYSNSLCDTHRAPSGSDTSTIPRPRIGSVPYGIAIHECTVKGTIALTFDDGPWIFTSRMLDVLDSFGVKATFFIVGNNLGKGMMDDASKPWPALMKRMYNSGHQLASHSWTHENLDTSTAIIQRTQILYNEIAFSNLFGRFPTYFRAPYLVCGITCRDLLDTFGYHLIDINIDTKDYLYNTPSLIQNSKDRFSNAVSADFTTNSYIELSHDIHEQTVMNLTAFMINTLRARGYRPVPVGECLGDPKENWYRASVVVPSPPPLPISPNQSCGGASGYTCQGSRYGNCCSYYGFCGSSPSYCGTGCQTGFGNCTASTGSTTTTTNGLCGKKFSATCAGYGTKSCCSANGFCGSTAPYCGTGCQNSFGTCT
ncbi:carbohydrate esterase family 4 protein [Amniculicola lignicola CBS 123094]|uniref:Carbohydrate esterase family 4 protein n=1 Tax=Amniculicola lignicola CBS 123094 TaxID=1392246 RepID=A0A6A5WFZ7_9PLEO|nr:carbohydrate esterase family 4 protein [Amniculicola lignicola CBS 123094]